MRKMMMRRRTVWTGRNRTRSSNRCDPVGMWRRDTLRTVFVSSGPSRILPDSRRPARWCHFCRPCIPARGSRRPSSSCRAHVR